MYNVNRRWFATKKGIFFHAKGQKTFQYRFLYPAFGTGVPSWRYWSTVVSVLQYRRESTGSVKGEHADGGRYIIINDVGTKCGYWPDRG